MVGSRLGLGGGGYKKSRRGDKKEERPEIRIEQIDMSCQGWGVNIDRK